MKNVILQDGTTSVDLIEEHAELIKIIKDKFDPNEFW